MIGSYVGKHRRNRIFLYTIIALVGFLSLSMLQLISKGSIDWSYYLAQFLSLLLGILHAAIMYRYMPFLKPDQFWKGFGITILLACLGALGAAITYYFLDLDYHFLTFLFPFVLPYVCWQTYRLFFQIPVPHYKLWRYPVGTQPPDLSGIDLSQVQVIGFVFYKKIDEARPTNFTARAPLNMKLGLLFFIFIVDYNDKKPHDTISFLDGQNLPYGWLFYKRQGFFKRKHYFDPDLSFVENGIRQNEFIYATRYKVK